MRRLFPVLFLFTVFLAFPAFSQNNTISDKSLDFINKAAMSNMFEIESSKVAVNKAQNQNVKSFADMMIKDHTNAGEKMKSVVASISDIQPPAALDDKHQKKVDDLQKKDASDFDDAYIDAQVKAHKDAVSLFEDYSKNGDNEALRQFATETLPTLRQHLDHINQIDKAD